MKLHLAISTEAVHLLRESFADVHENGEYPGVMNRVREEVSADARLVLRTVRRATTAMPPFSAALSAEQIHVGSVLMSWKSCCRDGLVAAPARPIPVQWPGRRVPRKLTAAPED